VLEPNAKACNGTFKTVQGERGMISENNETLISLKQAARMVPTFDGNTIHSATVWRWCKKGFKGIRLEYVRAGRRIATSREAMNRFFKNLTKLDEKGILQQPSGSVDSLQGASSSSIESRVLEAEETCTRYGI
jgi:hypothetical protein